MKDSKLKQQTLFSAPSSSCRPINQKSVDELIVNFVIETLQPFVVVESKALKKLVAGLQPGRIVLSRSTLISRLEKMHEETIKTIKDELEKIQYVCTTADA